MLLPFVLVILPIFIRSMLTKSRSLRTVSYMTRRTWTCSHAAQLTLRKCPEPDEVNNYATMGYEFIDSGDLKRVELFSGVAVVRSCPTARWPRKLNSSNWEKLQNVLTCISYDGTSGKFGSWSDEKAPKDSPKGSWTVEFNLVPETEFSVPNSIKFSLVPSDMGQVGVFPEQYENLKWIRQRLTNHYRCFYRCNQCVENGVSVTEREDRPLAGAGAEGKETTETPRTRKVLNGFAYTGGSTMAALSADDVSVVHLDAAKNFVQWARRNALLSELVTETLDVNDRAAQDSEVNGVAAGAHYAHEAEFEVSRIDNSNRSSSSSSSSLQEALTAPTSATATSASASVSASASMTIRQRSITANRHSRWITEDCMTFLEREVRRGNKYDGLIFDPPAFGRGGSGKIWKLERDLYVLVEELIPQLISDDPALILLSCHDPDWPAERLAKLLYNAVSGVAVRDIPAYSILYASM